jgi:hypothetical protein
MLAYGLFLAKLDSNGATITLANARQFVPGSFRLIHELVQFLDDLSAPEYVEIRWVVEEILSIVNGLDLHAIREDLSFKHRKAISRKIRAQHEEEHRLFERDPFIYFYEDFLSKYDAKMKKARGVYYTPPPIVNFIVRAVDDILKESFRIPDGLADHKRVTVLDFACGTGTFLLEVFQRIFDNIGGPEAGRAEPIVREHLLGHIFGFEYLIAPYTIAHLKLSQYLSDQGHPLKGKERLQVFLTNTLEPIKPQANFLLPAISAEVEAAQSRWRRSTRPTRPLFPIGDNSKATLAPAGTSVHYGAGFVSTERRELMAHGRQPDLFVTELQSDLFGAEAAPAYRPNPDKVRARLHKILAEARATRTFPWEPTRVSLYRTIFPQMTLWLPEDEAAQLRFEFDREMARLVG